MASTGEDAEVLRVFQDLVRCETRVYKALDEDLRAACGIVTSQFEFLDFVRQHAACRVVDLAAAFAVGVGATSKGVDRLEARGLLERRPNPTDRRSSLLATTARGEALVRDAALVVARRLEELLTVPGGDLAATGRYLHDLRERLERDQVGTPTG